MRWAVDVLVIQLPRLAKTIKLPNLGERRYRSDKSAITVKKLLRRTRWGHVHFFGAFHKIELHAEFTVQSFRIVPNHVKTTAFCRPVEPERTNNHMAARPYGSCNKLGVSLAVLRCGQEMKYSAIMPYVEGLRWQVHLRDVRADPADS